MRREQSVKPGEHCADRSWRSRGSTRSREPHGPLGPLAGGYGLWLPYQGQCGGTSPPHTAVWHPKPLCMKGSDGNLVAPAWANYRGLGHFWLDLLFCTEVCTISSMSEHTHTERGTGVAALSEARERLSVIVDEVAATGGEFLITKHGRPMAVLLASDEYESLIETLNILSDSDAMAAIREAEADLASGDLIDLD